MKPQNGKPKPVARLITSVSCSPLVRRLRVSKIERVVSAIEKTISEFVPGLSGKEKKRLTRTILYNRLVYQITPSEYFLYHFGDLNDHGKRAYIGDAERYQRMSKQNDKKTEEVFDNKYLTYQYLKPFFRRDVILLDNADRIDEFRAFASAHTEGIVKRLKGSLGKGVSRIDFSKTDDPELLLRELIKDGPAVLEEKIEQVPEMAAFHPASVNTVRYATFFDGDTVRGVLSFLRMGQGDSIVDNAGSGGILASVDVETGIVKTAGYTENGKRYLKHPETGAQIIGFNVPRWEELCGTAKEAALVMKDQPYIGWDFALTKDGWVIIEGNCRGQFVQQICDREGARELFEEMFG